MNLYFKIHAASAAIFDCLTDMEKYASAHPVINRITRGIDGNYLVHETMKLGFIPVSFTYPVTVIPYSETNTIVMKAVVMKMTIIEMTFVLEPAGDFTVVKEHISFRSVLPVRPILQSVFRKQHQLLFKNMEILYEQANC